MEEITKTGPTVMDKALHGRRIYTTPYAELWDRALHYLSTFASGIMYNKLVQSDVRFSLTQGDTACINMVTKKMYINPTFFREWIKVPSDLAGLILHELLHPIIDPENKYINDEITNIAADALINSMLYTMSPFLCTLHSKMYPVDSFPGALLRPGARSNWKLAGDVSNPKHVKMENYPDANYMHYDCYTKLYPTNRQGGDLFKPSIPQILTTFFPEYEQQEEECKSKTIIILGEASTPFKDAYKIDVKELKNLSEEERAQIKEIIKSLDEQFGESKSSSSIKSDFEKDMEERKSSKDSGTGKDLYEMYTEIAEQEEFFKQERQVTKEEMIRVAKDMIDSIPDKILRDVSSGPDNTISKNVKNIRESFTDSGILAAFMAASVKDSIGTIIANLTHKPVSNTTIIPGRMTRGGQSLMANGHIPTFYKKSRRVEEEENRATRIYIDVSGSMMEYIPWCMRLAIEMIDKCHSDIYGFSDKVVLLPIEDIKVGKYSSSGGTSFNEVIEHFVKKCPTKQALVITDGYDRVSQERIEQLNASSKILHCLLVSEPDDNTVSEVRKWCKKVFLRETSWWTKLSSRKDY